MIKKLNSAAMTEDQVKTDLQNVENVLKALSFVIPDAIDKTLIEAIEYVQANPILLALLTSALNRL